MAVLTNPREAGSHWYTSDGRPWHTMPQTGDDGCRPTTLRDARKMGLFPSVTGILSVIDKPNLGTWKMRQVAMRSHGVTRGLRENELAWADRMIEAAMAQVRQAAAMGSRIHRALDMAVSGQYCDPNLWVFVRPVLEWLAATGITIVGTEQVVVNRVEGYGGSTDLQFVWGHNNRRRGCIDYKTRKTIPGQPIKPYETEAMQLIAYCKAEWPETPAEEFLCANAIISTTEPGRMEVVKHDPIKLPAAWDAFRGAAAVWRYLKGYDPRTGASAR